MKLLLLFLSALILAQAVVKYDGHKVLRVNYNSTNFNQLSDVVNNNNIDLWHINSHFVDVRVAPQDEKLFENFGYSVTIEDLQEHIEVNSNQGLAQVTQDPFYSNFPTYDEVLNFINKKVQDFPDVAERVVLGKTYESRDIVGLKLGTKSSKKKIAYLQCTIHAREWITTTSCCWIIDQLLAGNQELLSKFEFHIFPVFNVDGYIYTRTDRLWRKNRQPNPSSSCIGTDLNRNYAFKWGSGGSSSNPCTETYMGAQPNSSPEIKAEMAYIEKLKDQGIAFTFDIHAYGGMWMCPWGYTVALPPNYNVVNSLMQKAATAVRDVNKNAYSYGTIANVIYVASGSSADWFLGDYGVLNSFAIEVAGSTFVEPPSKIVPLAQEIWAGVKATAEGISA